MSKTKLLLVGLVALAVLASLLINGVSAGEAGGGGSHGIIQLLL